MSEQHQGIVDLKRLPVGTHHFDVLLDDDFFGSLEKSEILSGKVTAQATLTLREEDYSLRMAVRGTVFVVCDRCLDPMPVEIDDEQEIFSEDEEMSDGRQATASDQLDLSWLAYEIASINIPLVHCHQAGGCNPQMDLLLQSHLCTEAEPDEIN